MSSVRTLKVFPKTLVGVATVLHDGSNSQGYPPQLEGFVVQAQGDVHFGDASVTGESDGFTIGAGDSVNIVGFLSRGSPFAYDLTKMYYVGGPWKMIIERQV